jgi:hypothetical protein
LSQEQAQHISSADQPETLTQSGGHEVAAHHEGEGEVHIHLPGPSYWPILLAASMVLAVSGLMINIEIAGVGLLLAFIFGIGWGMGWGLESNHEASVE